MKDPCYSVPFRCYYHLFDVCCYHIFVKCVKKACAVFVTTNTFVYFCIELRNYLK